MRTRPFFPTILFALLPPTALAQSVLWEFEGVSGQDQFGTFMGVAGDVDNDGFADILASSRYNRSASSDIPYVHVYSGRTGVLIHEISGVPGQLRFGYAVDGAGDVNGDGYSDILVGIPPSYRTPGVSGEAVVYSGFDASVLLVIRSPGLGDEFGHKVTGAGDLNGDGQADVVVAATRTQSGSLRGALRAYSGRTGDLLWTTTGVQPEQFGRSVEDIGDVNGDGISDLVAGSASGALGFGYGRVRVVSGADGTILSTIEGLVADASFGWSVAPVGDLDADGHADFAVGGFSSLGITGRVFVYSGATSLLLLDIGSGGDRGFGRNLSGGDVTGDGVSDILVGAAQSAQLFSGVDGSLVYRTTGQTNGDWYGSAVAIVGDTNGDGFAEYVVSAPRFPFTTFDGGTVYVYSRTPENGGTLCLGQMNSTGARGTLTATSQSGFSAAAVDLTLAAVSLPPNTSAFFVVSQDFFVVPGAGGSVGSLCIASLAMGRYSSNLLVSDSLGALSFQPDTMAIPLSSNGTYGFQVAQAGETYNFQLWYRDQSAVGLPVSNFTDAVTITFQ